jgi:hypothetical protein
LTALSHEHGAAFGEGTPSEAHRPHARGEEEVGHAGRDVDVGRAVGDEDAPAPELFKAARPLGPKRGRAAREYPGDKLSAPRRQRAEAVGVDLGRGFQGEAHHHPVAVVVGEHGAPQGILQGPEVVALDER